MTISTTGRRVIDDAAINRSVIRGLLTAVAGTTSSKADQSTGPPQQEPSNSMTATSPVPSPRTATSTSTARLRQGAQPTSSPTATRGSSTPAGFRVREVPPAALTQLNVLPSARGAVAPALPLVKAAASASMYLAGWVTPLPSMQRVPGHRRRADGPDGHDSFGRAAGWLGMPLKDETATPDGRGRYNHFEHGSICSEWASIGWETSFLGYPITDETGVADGQGRFNQFEGGFIHWTGGASAYARHHPLMFSKTQ